MHWLTTNCVCVCACVLCLRVPVSVGWRTRLGEQTHSEGEAELFHCQKSSLVGSREHPGVECQEALILPTTYHPSQLAVSSHSQNVLEFCL